jgi:hypothetical protein
MKTCPSGHVTIDDEAKFCSTCAASLAPPIEQAAPEQPVSAASMPTWTTEAPSPPVAPTTAPLAEPEPKKSRRKAVVLGSVAVLVALIGLAIVQAGSKERETISGTFTLFDIGGINGSPTSCSGEGGYSDVDAGMPVTIRDGDGTIVGSTSTRNATQSELVASLVDDGDDTSEDEAEDLIESLDGSFCTLVFEAEVDDAEFYEVEVGTRGSLSFRKSELEDENWNVGFTLGD